MTTNKITLELTLDELKLIDKHLWISVATKPILEKIKNAYPKPDVIEIGGVKYQRVDEPYCPDEPEYYDEVEWDEKDNPKPMDEVVDRLVKKYQAQKPTLSSIIADWWGDAETQDKDPIIADLVDDIEKWLPKEQSAAGSQNVYVECSVEGFNDCLTKIKGMLR